MSYTEIYRFTKKGNAIKFTEIKNAFRGAMAVWSELERRHLPKYSPIWAIDTTKSYSRCSDFLGGGVKEIWGLQHSDKLTKQEKICLLSTFDNVVVDKDNIPELISAFRDFGGNTSLPEQAKEIELLYNSKQDFIAIGWNQTSVNGDAWCSYNLNKKKDHWYLFEDIK
jgi:hypothetical protein